VACSLLIGVAWLGVSSTSALAVNPATISKSFGAASIPLNGSTSLSFAIGNPNPGTGLTSIGFTDNLPAGLVVATPSEASNDCGGTLTATAGSSSVSLSSGSLSSGSLCLISLNVTGTWGGEKKNSVTVGSSAGTGNTSTASLTVLPPAPGERVYWTNYNAGRISFANLDGGGGGDLATGGATLSTPLGAAIDPASGRIYWANHGAEKISFANLDGSGGGDLATSSSTAIAPAGVALDPAGGRIYWASDLIPFSKIAYANLDGSGGGYLATGSATLDEPQGVAVDPAAGRIYWANLGGDKISFAKLDGTGGGDLATGAATVGGPRGVAIDPAAGRIYWANDFSNKISFANLDGTGGGDLATTGATVKNPEGVAIDPGAGRIYWANAAANKISYANLDGSGGGDLDTAYTGGNAFPALLRAPVAAGVPVIAGGSVPGSLLSCSPGTWAPDLLQAFLYRAPQTFAYQWSLGSSDIAGATASSYTASTEGDYRCRVTASNFAGSAEQTSAAHAASAPAPTKPTLSALRETNSVFAAGAASTRLNGATASAHKRGTVFSFRLDQAATTRIAIQRRRPGRRVATLTRSAQPGLNRVPFSGRIRGHALRPGRYRAVFVASDSAGSSSPRALSFKIVKR
jgi:DNA-binding beta-propeller fold protein YncE